MSKSSDLLKLRDVPSILALLQNPELPGEQELIVPSVKRLHAEKLHRSFIEQAIFDGRLLQRTHAGTPLPSRFAAWNGGYVLRADLQQMLETNGINIQLDRSPAVEPQPSIDRTLEEQYADQEVAKAFAGRYTLEEVARILEHEAGERLDAVLRRLVKAAKSGELPTHGPGEGLRRDYGDEHTKTVRDFYEEAYWNDLNKWLEGFAPHNSFRFPCPHPPAEDDLLNTFPGGITWADVAHDEQKRERETRPQPRTDVSSDTSHTLPATLNSLGLTPSRRRDVLTAIIETACIQARSSDCGTVWVELRRLAKVPTPPFTGKVNTKGLAYTNNKNETTRFAQKSLCSRLYKAKKRTLELS